MKKIIFAILILVVIIVTTLLIINGNKNQNSGEISAKDYVPSGKYTDVRQERPLIEYDGYYSSDDPDINASVFYTDENTVEIALDIYRYGGFHAKNIRIDKNGIGKFYDETGEISEGIVIFEEGKITIETADEEQVSFLKDTNGNFVVLEKISTKIITETELNEEFKKALSDFNNINRDIFDVEEGKKYITLNVKPTCYILNYYDTETDVYKYYSLEEEGHYYTIDKESKKYITLEDLYPDLNLLNEYIVKKLEEKKKIWESTPNEYEIEEWPYYEFEGINSSEYFENYFKIDEQSNTVSIRVLDYPSEVFRNLGEIWVDVPLSL